MGNIMEWPKSMDPWREMRADLARVIDPEQVADIATALVHISNAMAFSRSFFADATTQAAREDELMKVLEKAKKKVGEVTSILERASLRRKQRKRKERESQ